VPSGAAGWAAEAGRHRLAAGHRLRRERSKTPATRDHFIFRSLQAVLLWIYIERLLLAVTVASGPCKVPL
jgi:hypothetical protein